MREKLTTAFCILVFLAMGSLIINCAIDKDYMIGDHLKEACFEASSTEADEVADETEEETETAKIECETVHFECVPMGYAEVSGTEPAGTVETTKEIEAAAVPAPVYEVDGYVLNEEVQGFLYRCLEAEGVEWWMPYAMMQIRQESGFDVNATALRNDGTYDKGLLQYAEKWWPWHCEQYGYEGSDIYDYFAQIAIYAKQVGERLNVGKSIEETISDHYTGGAYYNAQYVEDVLRWKDKTKEVTNE